MKRTLIFVVAVFILLSTAFFVVNAQVRDIPTVITYPAYIRSGPGPEYPSYGVLRVGALFRLDGRNYSGNWVRGITERGTVGWVDSGAVDITYAELSSLVILNVSDPFLLSPPTGDTVAAPPAAPVVATVEEEVAEAEVAEGEEAAAVVSPGLLPNIDLEYAGGLPAGNMINRGQGDHAVHLYPVQNVEGTQRYLHVYRIVGSEGLLIMSITAADVAPYVDNPPAQHTLLKFDDGPGAYGPAALYLLSDGTLQLNVGPDIENRVQVLIFEGPEAGQLIKWYVYVVN